MSLVAVIVNVVAAQVHVDGSKKFLLKQNGTDKTVVIEGQGKFPLNNVSISSEIASSDELNLSLSTESGEHLTGLTIPASAITTTALEWTIMNDEIEVFLEVAVIKEAPKDIIDQYLAAISVSQRPWYFKAEDVYAVAKTAIENMKLTDIAVLKRSIEAVDAATEAILKKFTSITVEDGFSITKAIDDFITSHAPTLDTRVSDTGDKLVVSLKNLKLAVQNGASQLTITATSNATAAVDATKTAATAAIDATKTAVDSAFKMAHEKYPEATDKVLSLAKQTYEKTDEYKKILTAMAGLYYEGVKAKSLSTVEAAKEKLEAAKSATADVVKSTYDAAAAKTADYTATAKTVIASQVETAQPYLIQALHVSKPYINKAAAISEPYITKAMPVVTPYVDSAKKV